MIERKRCWSVISLSARTAENDFSFVPAMFLYVLLLVKLGDVTK